MIDCPNLVGILDLLLLMPMRHPHFLRQIRSSGKEDIRMVSIIGNILIIINTKDHNIRINRESAAHVNSMF
jgi:hypothetical protein